MSDYKKTLQLPKTSFPMRANLAQNEPQTLKHWETIDAYGVMVAANQDKERYVLHDGPPYANGHIHLGTALNKVIKDIIVKSRNMMGQQAEYVPGWDCHGLPIEHKVATELQEKGKELPPIAVRKRCRSYASKFLDIQRKEFKRLGVFGTWADPYMTMNPAYEAATAGELANFMEAGSVTRAKKPIYWCISCRTALAEAEVEYYDHVSPSIFVAFPLNGAGLKDIFPQAEPDTANVVIWTTTPWTLPANTAVAVHPEFTYALVQHGGQQYILAKDLVEQCAAKFGWQDYDVLAETEGAALEGLTARHPFYSRESQVVLANYVTLEQGTGCVHTAPGHGRDDYDTGLRYGLEVLSPLDDDGRFLPSVEFFAGLTVYEANPKFIEKLEELGRLLAQAKMDHSYPHCWRCKKPVIYRATTQWFISMEANGLRNRALQAIMSDVQWIPAWGRERIYGMIENRPDWCISRQRTWGVPIVALLCEGCDESWADPEWMRTIVGKFKTHETGCDYWFEADISEIVPKGLACEKCGGTSWKKETDILDVWFDSGTSFSAVVEQRPECRFPADLYLEGSDQHRGWFHSSLLASVGTRGQAPYKSVLTHGYVVDGEGKKMSKSIGNVVAPQEIIDKYGAEILRLWVSSVDYTEDVRISDEILGRQVDAYRRIRNTCRYLLGNLNDFTPDKAVPVTDMLPMDRYGLGMAVRAHERCRKGYETFEFHKVFHSLHNLCVTDLSSFYLDLLKDRLYVFAPDSRERRSAQTALYYILLMLTQDMAPVLSFTAEEVFTHMPAALRPELATVFALRWEPDADMALNEDDKARLQLLQDVRSAVTRAIEPKRKAGEIGHSLDTKVTLYCGPELLADLETASADLRELCIVSQAETAPLDQAPADAFAPEELESLRISVSRAAGEKCDRCWVHNLTLTQGTAENSGSICPRCQAALQAD